MCGAGGYDEVTPIGPAEALLLNDGKLSPLRLDPADYGIRPCREEDLTVRDKAEAVAVVRELLEGRGKQAMLDMVTLNVALGVFLLEEDMDMALCVARAREAVMAGVGRRVINAA